MPTISDIYSLLVGGKESASEQHVAFGLPASGLLVLSALVVQTGCQDGSLARVVGSDPAASKQSEVDSPASTARPADLQLLGGLSEQESCAQELAGGFAKIIFQPMLGDSTQGTICTGSVVNSRTILTAAHCGGSDAAMSTGYFRVSCGCDSTVVTIPGSTGFRPMVVANPDPENSTDSDHRYDAAVLVAGQDLPSACTPVPLFHHNEALSDGDQVAIGGFGVQPAPEGSASSDPVLGVLSIGVAEVTSADYQTLHPDPTYGNASSPDYPLYFTGMVALREGVNGAVTCSGDSGSPYFRHSADGYYQVGLNVMVENPPDDPSTSDIDESTQDCPAGGTLVGHSMAPILEWLNAEGISYESLGDASVSTPDPTPAPSDDGYSQPPTQDSEVADEGPASVGGATVNDVDSVSIPQCVLEVNNAAASVDSLWRLIGGDGDRAACKGLCALTGLNLAAQAHSMVCRYEESEIMSLGGAGLPSFSVCGREGALAPDSFLRIRYTSEHGPCQTEIQTGTCSSAQSLPIFTGTARHISCDSKPIEPSWGTTCVALTRRSDSSSGSWVMFDRVSDSSECSQLCSQQRAELGSDENLTCVFRSQVIALP
jgi:hypothetical protein